MSIVAYPQTRSLTTSLALLAEKMEERRHWADAITDATFDRDAAQFTQADAAVNDQFECLAATFAAQGGEDGDW
jgi:hypothetical protein